MTKGSSLYFIVLQSCYKDISTHYVYYNALHLLYCITLFYTVLHCITMYCRLCFIEAFVHRDDCSKELLEWGSRVAAANSRPPNPQ